MSIFCKRNHNHFPWKETSTTASNGKRHPLFLSPCKSPFWLTRRRQSIMIYAVSTVQVEFCCFSFRTKIKLPSLVLIFDASSRGQLQFHFNRTTWRVNLEVVTCNFRCELFITSSYCLFQKIHLTTFIVSPKLASSAGVIEVPAFCATSFASFFPLPNSKKEDRVHLCTAKTDTTHGEDNVEHLFYESGMKLELLFTPRFVIDKKSVPGNIRFVFLFSK